VPHDNNAFASLSREKYIAHGSWNSLLHVHLNALCTRSAGAPVTFAARLARMQTKENPREKIGARLLQRMPLRVHSSTTRTPQNCHQDQIRRASHAKMCDFHRGVKPEMTHMQRRTSSVCASSTPHKGAGQPARYTDQNLHYAGQNLRNSCCAANADIRMLAMLVEFVCATTCIAGRKT